MKYSKELHEHALQRIHDQGEVISFGTPFVESLLEEISRLQAENKQYQNIFDLQKMTIDRLQAERRWIPISEPPKVKGEYICYSKPDIFTCFFGDSWDGGFAFRSIIQPTHWMPLPPPPEGA